MRTMLIIPVSLIMQVATAQQADLFNLTQHLKSKPATTFRLPEDIPATNAVVDTLKKEPAASALVWTLPNGDIADFQYGKMPVIKPGNPDLYTIMPNAASPDKWKKERQVMPNVTPRLQPDNRRIQVIPHNK